MNETAQDLPATRAPSPAEPPEDFASLVRQYPGLVVAGGLAIGMLAGVLIPNKAASKLTRGAVSLAALAGELGLALGTQAREHAGEAAREGRARLADLGENAGELGRTAMRRASSARTDAARTGLKVARAAVQLAKNARKG